MELKRIIARDSRTASDKAMALYGPDVLVIANNTVDGQTELIVAIDIEPVAEPTVAPEFQRTAYESAPVVRDGRPSAGNLQAFEEAMALVRGARAATETEVHEPAQPLERPARFQSAAPQIPSFGADTEDFAVPTLADLTVRTPAPKRRKPAAKATVKADTAVPVQAAAPAPVVAPATLSAIAPTPATAVTPDSTGTGSPRKGTAATADEPQLAAAESLRSRELVDLVRQEIATLRQEFQLSLRLRSLNPDAGVHPALDALVGRLEEAGIPAALRALLLDALRDATDPVQALGRLRELLQHAQQGQAQALPVRGVHAICGPSGAGKSQLAARWLIAASQALPTESMALISFHDQRPGAWSQTQMLAAQAGVQAFRAQDTATLALLLGELQDRALIVIDTAGTDPAAQLATLRAALPALAVHLALPADASLSTVRRLLATPGLDWTSTFVTKLDECEQPWPLLHHLCNQGVTIGGLAQGPLGPDSLSPWNPMALIGPALASLDPAAAAALPPAAEAPCAAQAAPAGHPTEAVEVPTNVVSLAPGERPRRKTATPRRRARPELSAAA